MFIPFVETFFLHSKNCPYFPFPADIKSVMFIEIQEICTITQWLYTDYIVHV